MYGPISLLDADCNTASISGKKLARKHEDSGVLILLRVLLEI